MRNDRRMSRIVVITTGGTIATSSDATGVARPTQRGADLVARLDPGGADPGRDVTVVDLLAVDSSELGPAQWQLIADAVADAAASGADGVVVTHGTDTLEETALWLDLVHDGATPVVLTGAMRSADDPDADGPANLRDALTLAGDPAAAGLGVAVCLGGTVWQPLGLTKTGSGFTGRVLGRVSGAAVILDRERQRPTVGPVGRPVRVDVVAAYAGSDGVAVDAFVTAGARGLVLEALGAGNAGPAVVEAVSRACAGGVAVVLSTRVPGGAVAPRYGPGRALCDAGAVPVPTLRPAQARVLLAAALGAGADVAATFARWG